MKYFKKITAIGILLCLLIGLVSCAGTRDEEYAYAIGDDNANSENVQEKKIEYYPNSKVPKLDSLLDENEIVGKTEYPIYGPYKTESEGAAVIIAYVALLESEYGFEITNDTVGYTLSNGSDEVVIVGGNVDSSFAVAVVVS